MDHQEGVRWREGVQENEVGVKAFERDKKKLRVTLCPNASF